MNKKLWLMGGLCFLLAACQAFWGRLQGTIPATDTATETARLSATDLVIILDTITPTIPTSPTPTIPPSATPSPVPATPTNTPEAPTSTSLPPTSTAVPEPTNTETLPVILSFYANPSEVYPGDSVKLSWETIGATGVTLYLIPPSHQLPQSGWDLPPTGSYTVTINPASRNYSEFLLYAYGPSNNSISQGLTVYLTCPDPWFFQPHPDICPTAPVYSFAAEQHFEHGVMLWIEVQDRIIVLFDDEQFSPKYSIFRDEWEEGQPDRDPSLQPPEGLQQPIRGFGLVWRSNMDVQNRLGWATQEEVGFDTIIQNETRYKYNATYIRAQDGNVWYLGPERSSWEKITIQN
jgi:hypothetical protein